jgi:exodeoxyribonuclease V alpha subunit
MLNDLEHAYAVTVHKSQGSEYRAVVFSICKGSPLLMHRSILYTAVTRARELLIIVGDYELVGSIIDNYRHTKRYSGLKSRLSDIKISY